MTLKIRCAFIGLGFLFADTVAVCEVPTVATYDSIQEYAAGTTLSYPDFSIQYLGTRRFPTGTAALRHSVFFVYDFLVITNHE